MRLAVGVLTASLALTALGCSGEEERERTRGNATPGSAYAFPQAPTVPVGPLDPEIDAAITRLLPPALGGVLDTEVLGRIAKSGDARLGWLVSDLLRFYQESTVENDALVSAFMRLTGVDVRSDPLFADGSWRAVTDHMLAWDLPAPPRYQERKAEVYLAVEPGWKPFFEDDESDIDWRWVAWGGVLIDNRELGDPNPCFSGCIPALDDPALTRAAGGDWYPDDAVVFGVAFGGEAVAFPKNIMEVHEMVNISIGGRRLGIPYCTLCGSAQAYLIDTVPARFEPLVLRTSGLLSRSNKLMYELNTRSAFDTFTGRAVSGPLRAAGVALEQTTVVTSTWGEWKEAHPDTRIVARDGGIGREYEEDPLGGRDDNGPIFPTGDVDPRLPVHVKVVGIVSPGDIPIAFSATEAAAELEGGEKVELSGVELVLDGGGLRAQTSDGEEIPAHEAFWFAWSQFHPDTELWSR
ncbi:MAG: DUF3179 domain-containing protein [Actinobacteria bacterium]|nr:DUF3179 domain-containing protein [Actinomycetota bacterium]